MGGRHERFPANSLSIEEVIGESARQLEQCKHDLQAAQKSLIGQLKALEGKTLEGVTAVAKDVRYVNGTNKWIRIGGIGMAIPNQVSGNFTVGPVVESGVLGTSLVVRTETGSADYTIDPGSIRPYDPGSAQ